MNRHRNIYWVSAITLLALGILCLPSCTSTPPPSRIVVEEPTRFVRLEVTTRASQQNHSHPLHIQKEELTYILEAFTVKPRSNLSQGTKFGYMAVPQLPESSPAFSKPHISFLAQHLSQALQRATPLEEVVFYMEEPQSQGTLLLTSGGAFFQEGQFHFLVANYRLPTIGQEEVFKARANPLTVLSAPGYDLIPGQQGKLRAQPAWKALFTALPQEAIISYEKTPIDSKLRKSLDGQHSDTDLSGPLSLTEKLRELEKMKVEGLITAQEFQTMRSKLLSSY
ncbi:MAG: SHOCT domain-containing protein [Nitrospirales bacterium]